MITTKQADKAARIIKTAYSWAKRTDDAVEEAIRNPDISEEDFDRLLEANDRALDKLADAIHRGTGGAITEGEADRLVRHRFQKVGELVARLAV